MNSIKKVLLTAFNESVLTYGFIPNRIKSADTKAEVDYEYTDKGNAKAKGVYNCKDVVFYQPIYDVNGYHSGHFSRIELPISELKKVMLKVDQIESQKDVIDTIDDDLPF